MVHYCNYQNGIQDCSRGNTYHNKRFKAAAECRGFQSLPPRDKYGWSITQPTEQLMDFAINNGLTDILINRNESLAGFGITGTGTHSGATSGTAVRPSSSRKYICSCCGNSVRATDARRRIACLDCAKQMLEA